MDRQNIGSEGEKQALKHLISLNYEILEQNFRYRKGEIDIICLHQNTLIFVEVKKRRSNEFGYPESSVTNNQQKLIIQTADHYLHAINWHKNIRYDIIAITGEELYHIEDAFY